MDALFGSTLRTEALVAIGRLSRTYPSEIARVLGRRLNEVQRAVSSLERAGAIVSKRVGGTRIVELNPRFWARDELYKLLLRLSELPHYEKRWSKLRRRPRRIGKPI
jgi:DNA-binding transcriptional ArsR family regulator